MATASHPLTAIIWSKLRISRHWVASVRNESKLKVGFVSLSATLLWLGAFGFCWGVLRIFRRFGNEFLGEAATVDVTDLVITRLLSAFSLTVFALLIVSNVLVAFATLYRSREVAYLIQAPISWTTFFLGRFWECVTFSSWSLAFLGSPALLAYGLDRDASAIYYLCLPLFFLPFVMIPAAIGSAITITLVRLFAGRRRGKAIGVLLIVAVVLLGLMRVRATVPDLGQADTAIAIVDVLGRTQSSLLPSTWVATGLLDAATGEIGSAVFYWLLLVANALLFTWLASLLADAWFYRGWAALLGSEEGRDKRSVRKLLGLLDRLLSPLREPHRSLTTKDLKLFWRDPAQWSQFLIFFGLMAIYVANVRSSVGWMGEEPWRSWIALLNTSASMLILATLTTRFVFPLISLEGRRFWILGLAPLTMRRLLRQKFLLSVITTSCFTLSLTALSGWRLQLEPRELAFSMLAIAATTIALSGLAVGLGALYPNFEEDNPSRITSGMGGTLNFILSLVYIVAVTVAQGVMISWRRIDTDSSSSSTAVALLLLALLMMTALVTWVPLRLGLRNLERAEF